MKLLRRLLIALCLLLPSTSFAYLWEIESFHSEITIHEDTSFAVQEIIEVDFESLQKHGIYRYIPTHYENQYGQRSSIKVHPTAVTDETGTPYQYTTFQEGPNLVIKIGSPDFTITGRNIYRINYEVERAYTMQEENTMVEFFWNTTGVWTEAPMTTASSTIRFPFLSAEEVAALPALCYKGYTGLSTRDCTVERGGNSITMTTGPIATYEQLSTAVQIPVEHMQLPSSLTKVGWFLQDNWIALIPLLFLLFFGFQWFRHGKEHPQDPIVPRWDIPADLTPSLVGTLIDDKAHTRDISAMMIQFAVHGFLTIKEIKKTKVLFWSNRDYEFTKLKEVTANDKRFTSAERYFFTKLFAKSNTKLMSALKNTFYIHIDNIQKKLYKELQNKKLYTTRPDKIRERYTWYGVGVITASVFVGIMLQFLPLIIVGLASGLLTLLIGIFMPKKTKKGARLVEHILGLQEYLSRAEKDRINFEHAPERSPQHFEELLPYAMVLGVEKEWAKQFEDIYKTPPSWYHSNTWDNNFSMDNLVSGMHDMTSSTGGAITSSPSNYSSSGGSGFSGGFSGGGFGGGGGGSW